MLRRHAYHAGRLGQLEAIPVLKDVHNTLVCYDSHQSAGLLGRTLLQGHMYRDLSILPSKASWEVLQPEPLWQRMTHGCMTHARPGVQVLQGHEPVDEAAAARLFAAMARYPDNNSSPEHETLSASLSALSIGFRPEVS